MIVSLESAGQISGREYHPDTSVGSRPNFRGRLIAEIFERLIDHGRPIEGKLKEKYNKKKRMKIGEEMAE